MSKFITASFAGALAVLMAAPLSIASAQTETNSGAARPDAHSGQATGAGPSAGGSSVAGDAGGEETAPAKKPATHKKHAKKTTGSSMTKPAPTDTKN